ncbi:Hypothetical protein CINCED_3A017358 [Cinara cedri]|uniref:Aftiphilin clathrin-binding box domain-containing protein n=1 Tax=Cinara cedri TaxID=506608 RepID=A0A5E4MW43_9HEMI|nr:Hypothetical protein CINCED_3A017358 [Cinara cedri]
MSDDIPPLISETPPPMSKSDWEDDDEFIDFPHLEMPSDNSLSPDGIPGRWNHIESLPYDSDFVDKPVDYIESNTNDSLPNWSLGVAKKDQFLESSISQHENSLHHNNLPIWKDKENIIPCTNIKQLTSNHICDSTDYKTEIKHNTSSENNVINSSTKIDEKLSVIVEQNIGDIENITSNITPQYLKKVELPLKNFSIVENIKNNDYEVNINSEKSSLKNTSVNGNVECVNIKEFSNQTSCVPNILLENMKNNVSDFATDAAYNMLNNVSVNSNNNNIIIKNDQLKYSDFETELPNSLNVPLPNRTSEEHIEIFENHESIDKYHNPDQIKIVQFNDNNSKIPQNSSSSVNTNIEQNNENTVDDNLDSEFDDFCDFHAFTNYDEPNISEISTENNFEHSNNKKEKCDNDDNNLTLKSNNQNNITCNIINDEDNFCDFESQVLNDKQFNTVLDSKSQVQIDYKKFCEDAFYGDYTQCNEINLQDLEHELNESLVWQHLKDIESSPALKYNWSKSESNNVFLSSLSIDSRNILYGAFWNPKFPRFAANMSDHPLEPLKSTNNNITDSKILSSFSSGSLQANVTVTIPDVQFDWKSSGLINPLDFQPQTWKISELVKGEEVPVKEEVILIKEEEEKYVMKDEEILVNEEVSIQSSPESIDIFNSIFNVSSKNQSVESIENSPTDEVKISLEAQTILDKLPDFEVLQKSYLLILEKENNNPFLR